MFIAHLPAGYLLTRHLQKKLGNRSRAFLLTGLTASILPDIDLFYFYFIDHRQTPHHHFMTHWPLFWLAAGFFSWGLFTLTRQRQLLPYLGVVLANVLLHCVMDSVMATIYWFEPFSDAGVNLLHITSQYRWWVLNYVLHWTFLIEIFIVLLALNVWIAPCKKPS